MCVVVCGCVFLVEKVEIACFRDLDECFVANGSLCCRVPPLVVGIEVSRKDASCWDIDVFEDSVYRVG